MPNYLKIATLFLVLHLEAESITIDGDLSEPEWEKAKVIDRFYEVSPYTLRETDSSERTKALIFSNKDLSLIQI